MPPTRRQSRIINRVRQNDAHKALVGQNGLNYDVAEKIWNISHPRLSIITPKPQLSSYVEIQDRLRYQRELRDQFRAEVDENDEDELREIEDEYNEMVDAIQDQHLEASYVHSKRHQEAGNVWFSEGRMYMKHNKDHKDKDYFLEHELGLKNDKTVALRVYQQDKYPDK